MKNGNKKTRWHRLLGRMLKEMLTPVDITVITEFSIMNDPPEADILLLRRDLPQWSDQQLELLPDGIRDTAADHILIEFKYTESVNRNVLSQALAYDTFYKRTQKLPEERIKTFVISSKTPKKHFFDKFGYTEQKKQGVYKSRHSMLDSLTILSLNDLTDEPHNQFIKCFASRKKVKKLAFNNIFQSGIYLLHSPLQWFMTGLWRTCFNTGGNIMELELTPEEVMEIGKSWEESYLNSLPAEKRLAGLRPEEVLDKLSIKDIEKYIEKLKKQSFTN